VFGVPFLVCYLEDLDLFDFITDPTGESDGCSHSSLFDGNVTELSETDRKLQCHCQSVDFIQNHTRLPDISIPRWEIVRILQCENETLQNINAFVFSAV
jgi:hypothetical protein